MPNDFPPILSETGAGQCPAHIRASFRSFLRAHSLFKRGPCRASGRALAYSGVCNRALRESARFAILRSGVRSPLGPPKKKAAERLFFSLAELRRGENPRFEHKDFFCTSKSAAQRRVGSAGQIRSVTERSGVSPLGPPKEKAAESGGKLGISVPKNYRHSWLETTGYADFPFVASISDSGGSKTPMKFHAMSIC